MKTLYAEKSIATPFASDKFYDLPGHLASWIEKKGRKKVEVAEDGENWIFKVKMLTPEDLRVLVINRLDGISIQKNKLFVKVRK